MAKTRALFENYQHTLVPALLLWMTGVLFGSAVQLPLSFYGFWTGMGFFAFLFSLWFRASRGVIRLWVWFLCFLMGGFYFTAFHFQPQVNDVSRYAHGNPVQMEGVLVDYGRTHTQWVLAPQVLRQNNTNHSVSGRVIVHLKSEKPLLIGETVQMSGFLRQPQQAPFPGDFNYRDYLYQNKITAVLFSNNARVLKQEPPSPWLSILRFTDSLRTQINTTFQEALPGVEGDILASVVLGDHAVGLERETKQKFIQSGLVHVLAASGLNVGLIGAFLLILGRILKLPLRFNLFVAMLGVGVYCLITGLPPSVLRVGTMFEIALLLKFIRKELHPVTLLGFAGFFLTVLNPMIIKMIGFQLSFLSSLGILVMVPPLQEKLGFYLTSWLADLLLVPIVAQLWVTPILIYTFHQVPLMSLPANLVAMPLVALLTYAGFVLGGLSLIVPYVTKPVISLLWFPAMVLNHTAQFFSSLSFSTLDVFVIPLVSVLALTAAIFILAYALNFPERLSRKPVFKILTACLLVMIIPVSFSKWQGSRQTSVVWIPDSSSSNIQVIKLPNQSAIATVQSLKPWTAILLSRYLKQQGISHLQLLIIENPLVTRLDGLDVFSQPGALSIDEAVFPKGLAEKPTNELVAWSLKTHVPIAAINDSYLVEGPGLRSTLYNIQNQETMIRTEMGHTCFINHWGVSNTVESPLAQVAQNCLMLNEQGWLKFRTNRQLHRVRLDTFHQVVITPDRLRIW